MNRFTFAIILLAFFAFEVQGQSFVFGLKGGPTLGVQTWGNSDRDPLFKYHGILFIESYREESPFSMFAQLGYHIKGSAVRFGFSRTCFDFINNREVPCNLDNLEYQFRNASLSLGGKKRFDRNGKTLYYLFGVRGDFTINTNLSDFNNNNIYYYGALGEGGVNKFNYGMLVGGGIEFELADLVGAMVEFTLAPDFSLQYRSEAVPNAIGPIPGQPITIPKREIRNIALELTVGLSFLRKVEYIDDDY